MTRPHAAAVVEDAWHRQLNRLLRSRGWVTRVIGHTGYGSPRHLRVFARVLLGRPPEETGNASPDEDRLDRTFGGLRSLDDARRGWRAFITAPAMDVPVQIRIGGLVAYGRSDRSGHIDLTIADHGLSPGWHDITFVAQGSEPVTARVVVVGDETTFGIVSDIDDTVISTSLPRPLIAAWNTFVRHEGTRSVVIGMAPMYRSLLDAHPGAPVVYLSTGAWNTAPTLKRFLARHGFPSGPLLLTDWGPTNTGWFRSGREHKRSSLERLTRDFPQIQWLLVGDDGQHDPATYEEFATRHPEAVLGVAIRQLTPTEQVLSHGLPLPVDELPGSAPRTLDRVPVPVVYAPDGHTLAALLSRAGLTWSIRAGKSETGRGSSTGGSSGASTPFTPAARQGRRA